MYTGSMIDIAQGLLCDHIVSCNVQTELKQTFVSPESSVSPFSSTAPVQPNSVRQTTTTKTSLT
tara:strand:+ start:436 stop:627 length:192 start_codon:yes stop_codon:yes gene_type:complete